MWTRGEGVKKSDVIYGWPLGIFCHLVIEINLGSPRNSKNCSMVVRDPSCLDIWNIEWMYVHMDKEGWHFNRILKWSEKGPQKGFLNCLNACCCTISSKKALKCAKRLKSLLNCQWPPYTVAKERRDSRDWDGPVAEVLPVHGLDRRVSRLERRVVDKSEALEVRLMILVTRVTFFYLKHHIFSSIYVSQEMKLKSSTGWGWWSGSWVGLT